MQPHEAIWVTWYDYQASCYWWQCRKCEEKFYVSDEFMEDIQLQRNKNLEQVVAEFVNDLHIKRIEQLCQPSTLDT